LSTTKPKLPELGSNTDHSGVFARRQDYKRLWVEGWQVLPKVNFITQFIHFDIIYHVNEFWQTFREMYIFTSIFIFIIINSKESEDISLQIKYLNGTSVVKTLLVVISRCIQVTRPRDDVKITQMANVTQSALQ
jgi:hypothetical protein